MMFLNKEANKFGNFTKVILKTGEELKDYRSFGIEGILLGDRTIVSYDKVDEDCYKFIKECENGNSRR